MRISSMTLLWLSSSRLSNSLKQRIAARIRKQLQREKDKKNVIVGNPYLRKYFKAKYAKKTYRQKKLKKRGFGYKFVRRKKRNTYINVTEDIQKKNVKKNKFKKLRFFKYQLVKRRFKQKKEITPEIVKKKYIEKENAKKKYVQKTFSSIFTVVYKQQKNNVIENKIWSLHQLLEKKNTNNVTLENNLVKKITSKLKIQVNIYLAYITKLVKNVFEITVKSDKKSKSQSVTNHEKFVSMYKQRLRLRRKKRQEKRELRRKKKKTRNAAKKKYYARQREKAKKYSFLKILLGKHRLAWRALKQLKQRKRRRRKSYKGQQQSMTRLQAYPLSMYGLFLKNRHAFVLPPSKKRFHLLKVLILSFKMILQSSFKRQFYFLSTLRHLLLSLCTLPGFHPKLFLLRQLNLFFIKEFSFRHLNIYYFKKIFKSRFLIFQGAFTALISSIKAFDKNDVFGISFIGMHVRNVSAPLVCNYIIHKLGQYFTIQEILRPVVFDLRSSPLLAGFRIIVAGRLTRKERAAFMVRKNGNVTLAKKDARITYAADFKIMRFGVVGVKVWFQIKKTKPYFYRFNFLNYIFYSIILCLFSYFEISRLLFVHVSLSLGIFATALRVAMLQNKIPFVWRSNFVKFCFKFKITQAISLVCCRLYNFVFENPAKVSYELFKFGFYVSTCLVHLGQIYRFFFLISPDILCFPSPFNEIFLLIIGLHSIFRVAISLGRFIVLSTLSELIQEAANRRHGSSLPFYPTISQTQNNCPDPKDPRATFTTEKPKNSSPKPSKNDDDFSNNTTEKKNDFINKHGTKLTIGLSAGQLVCGALGLGFIAYKEYMERKEKTAKMEALIIEMRKLAAKTDELLKAQEIQNNKINELTQNNAKKDKVLQDISEGKLSRADVREIVNNDIEI